ncbi:MAG: trypsin-like serine protease [Hoeflea sp.]
MSPIPDNAGVRPLIIGGEQAKHQDWPSSLHFTAGGKNCTSTIIGDKALLSAAHCLSGTNRARVVVANTLIEVVCKLHPGYRTQANCNTASLPQDIVGCTADVAMCRPVGEAAFPRSAGKFESIKMNGARIQLADKIVLLGFGCTIAGGPISSDLQFGNATVVQVSSPGASSVDRYKALEEYVKAMGPGISCDGDSGGAVFTDKAGGRTILGLVSRGNLTSSTFIVDLRDDHILDWIRRWETDEKVAICGLNASANNCMGG